MLSITSGNLTSRTGGLCVIATSQFKRFLSLHEYQAKELMDKFGVPTQVGYTASTSDEAEDGARKLLNQGFDTVVIKSQIFAGGRGKGNLTSGLHGGVQFAKKSEDVKKFAKQMIGYNLITHQTGPDGLKVNKLLLTEAVPIDKEFYLAIILDRSKGGPVVVASREGGVDIEEVAEKHPEAITVEAVDILQGITEQNVKVVTKTLLPDLLSSIPESAKNLPWTKKVEIFRTLQVQLKELLEKMYKLFTESDASQIEINPLAITSDHRVVCVDAKLNFDDNASFRQKELFGQEDTSCRDARELEADKSHLTFIAMDGNIGCLVNGAGLAMATMDLIALNGCEPANFLDLGGGADKDQVLASFKLLTSDPKVQAIFVNIFGGITRCDVVAQGILEAAQELKMNRPLVVRLVGNNADKAKEILNSPELKRTGLNITYVQDFSEAAKTVCDLARATPGKVKAATI